MSYAGRVLTESARQQVRRHEPGEAGDQAERLESFTVHAELCRVLTDPKRLMILDALRRGDRSVTELASQLGCSMPNASQHLTVLRSAGLVAGERDGTTVRYHLTEPEIMTACDIVGAVATRLRSQPPIGRTR